MADAALIIYNGLGLDDWATELSAGTETYAATDGLAEPLAGDPHAWLSPSTAAEMAAGIRDRLTQLDPDGETEYAESCAALTGALYALLAEYKPQIDAARLEVFVTGHAAFGYLARELGLYQESVADVFGATEPTARQLAELVELCSASGIKYVLSESNAPRAVSETLARECGAEVLPVYMMESAEDGLSLLERTEKNLEAILKALR